MVLRPPSHYHPRLHLHLVPWLPETVHGVRSKSPVVHATVIGKGSLRHLLDHLRLRQAAPRKMLRRTDLAFELALGTKKLPVLNRKHRQVLAPTRIASLIMDLAVMSGTVAGRELFLVRFVIRIIIVLCTDLYRRSR